MSERTGRLLIVGVGELLWDLFSTGRRIGGAPANVAAQVRTLGAEGIVVSRVGDDPLGWELRAQLAAAGMSGRYVGTDPLHATGTVRVTFESGEPRFTVAEDVAWDYLQPEDTLLDLAATADAICYGTLAQRAPTSRATIGRCLAAAKSSCLRVFDVNLREDAVDSALLGLRLEQTDVLKLNEAELPRLGTALGFSENGAALAATLVRRFDLRAVALTQGPRGCTIVTNRRQVSHPGFPVDVVDTVGAGDAFTAALTVGILQNYDLETISASANRIASETCRQQGAWPVQRLAAE
jgi:fructokinase